MPDESPAHEVALEPFWVDAREVTVAEFARFVEATGYRHARHGSRQPRLPLRARRLARRDGRRRVAVIFLRAAGNYLDTPGRPRPDFDSPSLEVPG